MLISRQAAVGGFRRKADFISHWLRQRRGSILTADGYWQGLHGPLPFVRHGDSRRRASSCDYSNVHHLALTDIVVHGTVRALPVSIQRMSDTGFCKTVLLSNVCRRSSRRVQVHPAGRCSYICATAPCWKSGMEAFTGHRRSCVFACNELRLRKIT